MAQEASVAWTISASVSDLSEKYSGRPWAMS